MVYALDIDSNMIEQAHANLLEYDNIQVIQSDIAGSSIMLPFKVDVVFSNAVLHWIGDHRTVFANFARLLKDGGQLLAQCGGQGNLRGAIAILEKVAFSDDSLFRQYFAGWKNPWNFATPSGTEKVLHQAGFENVEVNLSTEQVTFSDRITFSTFVRTAVIRAHLGRLPDLDLQNKFIEVYLDECGKKMEKWSLDYVRLNITAEKK